MKIALRFLREHLTQDAFSSILLFYFKQEINRFSKKSFSFHPK